jgi:hypothetical protein
MTEPVDRQERAAIRRFARKYQIAFACRPVAWDELGERQKTPNPGPQHFMCMLSRMIDGQQVVLQWPIVQVRGGRSLKPISLAVALTDLRDDLIMSRDRREHGAIGNPEDAAELSRVEDTLQQMFGAKCRQRDHGGF